MNGYAQVKPDSLDAKKIVKALTAAGVKGMDVNKLHVTLMYDKRNPDIDPKASPEARYQARISGIEHLGEPGSKWEAAVLKLDCPNLVGRHMVLRTKGYEHSYPKYNCHMSIGYGTDIVKQIPKLRKMLEQGDFPTTIMLSGETWEPIKED
jgi:hypothetical protein